MENKSKTEGTAAAEEKEWREWEIHRDHNKNSNNNYDDSDEEALGSMQIDLFAPPNPYQTIEYKLPNYDDHNHEKDNLVLKLRGYADHPSTGLALWLGSDVFADYLASPEGRSIIQNQYIVELGAGIGLCGIVAHLVGASRVVMTDGDSSVLENLRYNVQQQQTKHTRTDGEEQKQSGTISCRQLIWGHDIDKFIQTYGKPSVILASNVYYMTRSLEPFWQTVDQLLTANGTFLYLGNCASQSPKQLFRDTATKYGFQWTIQQIDQEEIYTFRRKDAD